MGGIKLQLLCGVRIELTVGTLPIWPWLSICPGPFPYHVLREEGALQIRQPLWLEAESHQGPTHK